MFLSEGHDVKLDDRTKFEPECHHDKAFTCMFLCQLVAVIAWVGYNGHIGSYEVLSEATASPKVALLLQGELRPATTAVEHAHFAAVLAFTSVAMAVAVAVGWLMLLYSLPAPVVQVSLLFLPTVSGFMCAWSFVHGQILPGVLFAVVTAGMLLFAWSVQDRVEFTSKMFKCVSLVYQSSFAMFLIALCVMFLNALFSLLWLLAVTPLYVGDKRLLHKGQAHPSNAALGWVLLLLSFFWTVQVLSNVLHVACSGLVARWYYNKQMDAPVLRSTAQAFKNYFGSVCFGSLLIAIIQTLRALVRMAQEQAREDGNLCGEVMACCADCFLSMIESLAVFFNTYAMVIVAIFGLPFLEAGQGALRLFERAGIELVIQYSLVDIVNGFGCFAGAGVVACINAVLAWSLQLDSTFVVGATGIGFLVGFAIMAVVSRVVSSGCDTLFVCFAENPVQLQHASPPLYETFLEKKKIAEQGTM
mmetsp:Transcript_119900/g.334515  ORF Transcript_119900/g.334515 Transcript_119900/m.334515 type:complete len:473 (+) Transcript_119900:81-1499(+)